MVGVHSATAEPDENTGLRDAVDEPREVVAALLMAVQRRHAGDLIRRRACVESVSVVRRHSARHEWWNRQSLPLVNSKSAQQLAGEAKPLVVKPVVNPRHEDVGGPQVLNRGGRNAADQREKTFVVILNVRDGQHTCEPPNEKS